MNNQNTGARVWWRVTLWGVTVALLGVMAASLLSQALALAQAEPAVSTATSTTAQTGVSGETMAHTCAACHGTYGRLGDESFMPLAGMPQAQFVTTMIDFREGRRPSTLMGHVAQGFSDAEIRAMGAFFAAVPPQPGVTQ